MYLEQITGPDSLHHINNQQIEKIAEEIRSFLVTQVSQTGGHLGPNLGVVELTIALHKVFSSPQDHFIFDTGHQAYVHKILTGRRNFTGIRTAEGLSGYPSRTESAHDIVENSHASTALSWADGISHADMLAGNKNTTIALIGDGAMTGGMAWEAINNISANPQRPLVIVVNDNGRSYAPTIGGFAKHINALRLDKRYEKFLKWGRYRLHKCGKPGKLMYQALHSVKTGMRDLLVKDSGIFTALGLKYIGPVDGHDIAALTVALGQAKEFGQTVVVHVITEKGRGYTPAETNEADRFHAVGVIHPETGLPLAPERFEWTNVFGKHLVKIARNNEKIVAITAAMLLPVGIGEFEKEFPERIYDVGIAEQHAVTMAAGLAYGGYHPVVALYATFLNRAFDQVLMDVALHKAGVTFVLDRAGITGQDGASHNGMWDIALISLVPGLRLAIPRDALRIEQCLEQAVQVDDAPTVLRYPKGALGNVIESVEQHPGYEVLRQASNPTVVLIGLGPFALTMLQVAEKIVANGHIVEVIDPVWAVPVHENLVQHVQQAKLVVCIEDGLAQNGFGSLLREALVEAKAKTQVLTYGIPDEFLTTDSRANIMAKIQLTPKDIVKKVQLRLADN